MSTRPTGTHEHGERPKPSSTGYVMQAELSGEGRPLVLVGGGLTGWASWAPHAERLAAERRVARLQLLNVGYGLEDRPLPEDYSVRLESGALGTALDALGWREPVDIVAWSYGALVTLDYALNQPARIRSLTLIEPPAIWVLPDRGDGDPQVKVLRALAVPITAEISETDLARFVEAVAISPPGSTPRELPQWESWVQHRRSLRNGAAPVEHQDDVARLRSFARPVLLVTGTGTTPFLRRIHDTLAATLPDARAIEMPAGHGPHLVSLDRFLAELERFHAALD